MMELALVDEAIGNNDEAALLYRTANPGNSICGAGERERLNSQIQGAIRSEERRGRCRSVVAEYLLFPGEENFPGDAKANASYHVSRLSQAGFDVNRLYRGAWVTANRSSDEKVFRTLIAAAPPSLREKANSRLRRKGPEAWAERLSQGRFDDKISERLLPFLQNESPQIRAQVEKTLETLRSSRQPMEHPQNP